MRSPRFRAFVALGLMLGAAAPAAADLYRWVGADGRVTYGDRPPSNASQVEARSDLRDDRPVAAETPGLQGASAPDAVRERVRERLAALEDAQSGVVRAQHDLERARQALDAGAEPRDRKSTRLNSSH